jgi:hypothetical protein
MEVSGQLHAPAVLPPEKEPLVPSGDINIYIYVYPHTKESVTQSTNT